MRQDVGEADETENPGDSDTTEDETTEEGEERKEEKPADPAADDTTEETPEDDGTSEEPTDPVDSEIPDEEQIVQNPPAEDETPAEDEYSSLVDTDALVTKAETRIIVKGVATNDKGEESLTDLKTAEVIYTNGCAEKDGSKMREGVDVTFRVLPTAGNTVTGVSYVVLGTEEEPKLEAESTLGTEGVQTIDKGQFSTDGKNDKNVLIVVRTKEVKYTLAVEAGATGVAAKTPGKDEETKKDALLDLVTEYTYSKANSIKIAMTNMAAGTTYKVEAKAGDGEALELKAGTPVAEKDGVAAYVPYTLNVSALNGAAKYADQTITVTVTTVAETTVAASAADVDGAWGAAGGAFAAATIAEGKTGYTAYTAGGSYNVGTKVAFQVTDAEGWTKVDKSKITAKLTKSGEDDIALTVSDAPKGDFTLDEGVKGFYVEIRKALVPGSGYTLEIAVDAELDDTAKKITFKYSAPDGVIKLEGGESTNPTAPITKTYVKTTEGAYYLNITSREGYQIQEVKVTLKGKYDDTKNGTFNPTYTLDGSKKKYAIKNAVINFSGDHTPGVTVKDKETGEETTDGKSWTATEAAVEIVLGDSIEGADEEKKISFGSVAAGNAGNPYKYEVKTSEQVTFDEETQTATIAEGTQYLNFTVAAETEPQVELKLNGGAGEADHTGLLETVSEAAGKFEYRVAAKALIGEKGHISITRLTKTVSVTVTGTGATVSYKDTEEGSTKNGSVTADGTWTVAKDAPLEITVTPSTAPTAAPIASVTYKVGSKGTAQTAAADSTGKYTFSVKASDNVTVEVKKAEDERLFIQKGAKASEVIPADSTVDAGYEEEIKAWVENKSGTKIELLNATVTDNGVIAETKASIEDNVAILTVAKEEYEKALKVTLMKKDRTTVSFTVVSDKAVESGVTVTGADGTEVTSDALDADTVKTYKVTAESGNIRKLAAVVVDTTDEAVKEIEGTPETSPESSIDADLTNGVLTVTAKPAKEKVEKAGTILIYDEKIAADENGRKPVLASLKMSVNAPVVVDVTAEADKGAADGRSLPVIIKVPEVFKNVHLEEGAFGYEIKVKKPENMTRPADMDQDDWDAITASIDANLAGYEDGKAISLESVIAAGGHTIAVLSDDVKPAKLEGFTIEVTPVQYMDADDRVDAEKKILGKPAILTEAGTTAPVYSDTLNLGKGTNTLTTGQDADIVVATPVFAKDAQYKRVEVEIINNTTGRKAWPDSFTDSYTSEYLAKWNPVNGTVTVNAKELSYSSNAAGSYKDLAVKVTAYTEKEDYGVSGTKKLSVVNGIQDMGLDVQPEILFTGKKVTVKSAIDYNTYDYGSDDKVNKKMAPKKKAAVYSIVGADDYTEQSLSANLTAVVDNKGTKAVIVDKSGKITVAKDFVPSKNAADNTFRLKAVAADYAGNGVEVYSDPIEIVSTGTTLGSIAIFRYDSQKNGWTMMPAGDIPTDGSYYKLAVLKPGVPAKNTYDVDGDGSGDTLPANLFDFKSSNKNIVVDSDGDITVKKLGKTNFTAAARSDAKNKAEMKNVNFVMENTDLYVEVTRYQDSTFKKVIDTRYFKAAGQIDITGNTTGYFSLNVKKYLGKNRSGEDVYRDFILPNYAFSFKNAKQVKPVSSTGYYEYTDDAYFVATGSTGRAATIVTVNNKGVKPAQKFDITITNATAPTGNAPKLAMTHKKQRIVVGQDTSVNITVTAAKKGETIPVDTYVMLSADQTKKTKGYVNSVFDGSLDKAIRLDGNGGSTATFSLGMEAENAEGYTLIATLGTMTDGVFTQTHKEARITLKAVKANENIKATTSYTLNPYGVSSQKLVINGGDGTVCFADDAYRDTDENGLIEGFNYAKNQIQKGGTPNEFRKYFKVTAKADGRQIDRIMVNPDLSYEDLQKLDDKDFQKANTTGYITVTNGFKKVDVKLTVKLKTQKDLKLKASATPVIAGKDVITDIQIMDGKTPVAIEQYTVSGGKSFQTYYTTEVASDADEAAAEAERLANGIIRVKAATAEQGKDTVDVKVLLAGTADGYKAVDETNNAKPFDRFGIDVKGVSVKIDALTTGNKVVLSNSDKNWKVENNDWAAEGEFYGWQTTRNYSFKNRLSVPAGSEITVSSVSGNSATPYVSFDSDAYNVNGGQKLTISLDKNKLQEEMGKPKSKLKPGAKVKAKAIFSYAQQDKDGNAVKSSIKNDEVTFTITLPEAEGYANADALNDAIAADKSFQNLVDVKTAKYHSYLGEPKDNGELYSPDDVRAAVERDLKTAVREMAKGTSAAISAESDYADPLYTFTLTVAGKEHVYKTRATTPTAASVAAQIRTLYGTVANAETAEKLGLSYYPATSAGDLAGALRSALAEENLMTRNISLSVSIDQCNAPKVNGTGSFVATVTVTDRNKEPESSGWSEDAIVRYTFPGLAAVSTYTDDGVLAGLLKTGTAVTDLFSKAYTASGGDIAEDNEIGDKMKAELIKQIEEFAQKQITNNTYLKVKGIDANTFECEWNGSTGWTLAFDIVYTDSTPGTKTPEIKAEVKTGDAVSVTKANVESIKQADSTNGLAAIKAAVTEAVTKAKNTIDPAATKEAAIAAIEKLVKAAIVSPKYDAAKSLLIEVPEGGEFVAPKGENNGKIDVKVTYNKDKKENEVAVTSDFTFIILAKKSETEAEETAKAIQLVQSTLTEARVNVIVRTVWKKKADGTLANDTAELLTAIKEAVQDSLDNTGITKVKVADAGVAVTAEGFEIPEDSKKKGKVPGITVTLQQNTGTSDTPSWEDMDPVTIGAITLNNDVCFQSKKEFLDTIKTKLQNTDGALAYDADYFDEEGKLKKETADQTTLKDAIKAQAGELAKDAAIATNPQWENKTFDVTATDAQVAKWTNSAIAVTLNITGDSAADDKRDVSVKLLSKDQTPTITGVTLKKVTGGTMNTTDNTGASAEKPIQVTSDTKEKAVTFEVEVAATTGTAAAQKQLTWAIQSSEGAAAPAGVAEVTMKANEQSGTTEKATLTIPVDAYAADGEAEVVKLVGRIKDEKVGGEDANKKVEFFVNIGLKEEVKSINLTNEAGTAEAQTTFEAPTGADASITYTFNTKLVGSHIKDTTKAVIQALNTDDEKVTFTPEADSKATLTVKTGAEEHTTTKKPLKVTAKVGTKDVPVNKNTITITPYETAAGKVSLALGSAADTTWAKASGTPKPDYDGILTVSNETIRDVKIPITITDPDKHKWDVSDFAVKLKTNGSSQLTGATVGEVLPDTLALVEAGRGVDKNTKYLVIKNGMPALTQQKADPKNEKEEIDPVVLELTATSTAEEGKAAVTKTLIFVLIVNKTYTAIDVTPKTGDTAITAVNGIYPVTKAADGDTTVTLEHVVKGAHVLATNAGDQEVKWEITSQGAKSTATVTTAGALIIPNASEDNIIKVTATSKKNENVTKTVTFKVSKTGSVTPPGPEEKQASEITTAIDSALGSATIPDLVWDATTDPENPAPSTESVTAAQDAVKGAIADANIEGIDGFNVVYAEDLTDIVAPQNGTAGSATWVITVTHKTDTSNTADTEVSLKIGALSE